MLTHCSRCSFTCVHVLLSRHINNWQVITSKSTDISGISEGRSSDTSCIFWAMFDRQREPLLVKDGNDDRTDCVSSSETDKGNQTADFE